MKFMKSVYSRPLLALLFATSAIFVTSAEASTFVSSSVVERVDGAVPPRAAISGKPGSSPAETAVPLANLNGVQLLAQLDQRDGKQDEGGKACADCPEMVPIPGKKFAMGKYA